MKIKSQLYINPLENIRSYNVNDLKGAKCQNKKRLFMIAHIAAERKVNLRDTYSDDELSKMTPQQKAANQVKITDQMFEDHQIVLNEVKRTSTLTEYIRDWYGRDLGLSSQEYAVNMAHQIRGFLDNGSDWYFLTQVDDYDAIDANLLSGGGDGSAKEYFDHYFINGHKYPDQVDNNGGSKDWAMMVFSQRIKNATASLSEQRVDEVANAFNDDQTIKGAVLTNVK
ncbi:hypothetical protein ACYATP_07400 [Lactobacillaceae bacterium Melli_B4]